MEQEKKYMPNKKFNNARSSLGQPTLRFGCRLTWRYMTGNFKNKKESVISRKGSGNSILNPKLNGLVVGWSEARRRASPASE